MSYLHIQNLYRCQDILLFKACYALEKVHGTSAHISYHRNPNPSGEDALTFFSGGEKHDKFVALFDRDELLAKFRANLAAPIVTVYGEAYGGKCQGMKESYGDTLRFIVFDVRIGDCWLDVVNMTDFATGLGLEVVPWVKTSTDLSYLDLLRDAPSDVAERRGCGGPGAPKKREGIVLRPLIELTKNNGERVIAKHKCEAFSERVTPQKVADPAKLAVLTEATAIANEWVTLMRLAHVLDKLPPGINVESIKLVIEAMIEDVLREAAGEIVDTREVRSAIGRRAADLFRQKMKDALTVDEKFERALGFTPAAIHSLIDEVRKDSEDLQTLDKP